MDNFGCWSLVPAFMAIVLALLTREIILSLMSAILAAAAIHVFVGNAAVAAAFHSMTDDFGLVSSGHFGAAIGNGVVATFQSVINLMCGKMAENMSMILFLCFLGALVSVLTRAGGAKAYGDWAYRQLKSERAVNLMTVVMGLIIFIDDYFNCLTVGTVMRPVTDKFKISRAKLAYFIDTTAAPVCILSPISSWAAYVIGCLPKNMQSGGMHMYMVAAPLNFYAILSLAMVLFVAVKANGDFGLMRRMQRIARRHRDVGAEVVMRDGLEPIPVSDRGRVVDLVVPLMALIALSTWLLAVFDAGIALALAAFMTLAFAFVFLVVRRVIDYHQFAAAALFGIKTMVPALTLLALAWGISEACTNLLGTGRFIASGLVAADVSLELLPAAMFVVAAVFAFATGASWGAIGILVPIGMAVCQEMQSGFATLTLAATLAGSVMGDHCSPISDTTILASAGAQCKHMNHVMTQLPYALVGGGLSILAYVAAGCWWK